MIDAIPPIAHSRGSARLAIRCACIQKGNAYEVTMGFGVDRACRHYAAERLRGWPGDKSYHQEVRPTLGQQLLDLKKAKDAGAINDAEYEAQKTKLLEKKSS